MVKHILFYGSRSSSVYKTCHSHEKLLNFRIEFMTEATAFQLFSQEKYDAVIFDASSNLNEIFSLLGEIFKQYAKEIPKAVFNLHSSDLKLFCRLKDEYRVHYVIDETASENVVCAVLKRLCDSGIEYTNPEGIPDNLFEKYTSSIALKISCIELLITQYRQDCTEENLLTLKNEIHKVAGSASAFGFKDVSALCRAFERTILDSINSVSRAIIIEEQLDSFKQSLRLYYQHIHPSPPIATPSHG